MRSRTRQLIRGILQATLVLAVVAAIAVLVLLDPVSDLFEDEAAEADVPRDRSEITEATLSTSIDAEGELVAVEGRTVTATGPGTITAVATVGQSVTANTMLYEVDGQPVVALIGDVPSWRTMTVDDAGADVAQLERNLADLGYDPDGEMTVDDTFTSVTAEVVERWQTDLGVPVTGSVTDASVVFVPQGSEVTSVSASVGRSLAGAASPVLRVSTSERELRFTVAVADLDAVADGTEVEARLPDRSTITAVVSDVRSTGQGWEAVAAIDQGAAVPDGERIPVDVSWSEVLADQATTVRANALTRLDSGAYVVEVVDGTSTRFVEVEIGARSGSMVEIISDLAPGTTVISP